MNTQAVYSTVALAVLLHIFISVHFSKETYLWEQLLGRRIALIVLIWLIPFIGAFISYKYLKLDKLKTKSDTSSNSQSAMSAGLLEMDSIFNPGQKHVAEAKQEVVVETRKDEPLLKNRNED